MASYTSQAAFESAYKTLFDTFASNKTKSLKWRKWQLKQIWWMIEENEEAIVDALHRDLNRSRFETMATEIRLMKTDVLEHVSKLEDWSADEIPDSSLLYAGIGNARIRKEPLGVALIVGAWNYPFSVSIRPMIAAISAGCAVMLKPSELCINSQSLMAQLIPKYLDESAVRVVTGGPKEMSFILEHKFNHIFFTGSNKIARYITAAAGKHLTPTVLELGGQGPTIVTKTADVDLAAKRIAAAKYMNAGQVCLNVNHVFADPAVHDELLTRLQYWNDQFNKEPGNHPKIVNERNFDRLVNLMDKSGGEVVCGGERDRHGLQITQTVVKNVTIDDALMDEELFGPICPVIKADYKEACKITQSLGHPLGLYIFSSSQEEVDYVLNNTLSGGVTINDVFIHAAVPGIPFGGVGDSGYGSYQSKHGFDAFTHRRVVVELPTWMDKVMAIRYPPYQEKAIPKIEVKNTLGFKKGETMDDQKIRTPSGGINRALMYALGATLNIVLGSKMISALLQRLTSV